MSHITFDPQLMSHVYPLPPFPRMWVRWSLNFTLHYPSLFLHSLTWRQMALSFFPAVFFFFYPRSFPLLYQFLPFLLSCYFNEVLLGKFNWEFSWRCSSIKLTCCSRNRSILMPSPANLVNYKFFVVLLTQQISIQLHKFSVKYVNSLLPI